MTFTERVNRALEMVNRILHAPGLNLGPEIGCLVQGFVSFLKDFYLKFAHDHLQFVVH